MTITELIFQLAAIEEEYGDLNIYTVDGCHYLVKKCSTEEVDINDTEYLEEMWGENHLGKSPNYKPPKMQKVVILE